MRYEISTSAASPTEKVDIVHAQIKFRSKSNAVTNFLHNPDIEKKINRFQTICGTIGKTLGGKTRKKKQEIL